jgi:LacI family transcriptional regulator
MMKHEPRRVAILVDTATWWGRQLIRGVINYTQKHEPWRLWIEPRSQYEALRLPQGWLGEGVIARVSSPQLAKALRATGLPVVNISGIVLSHADFPRVTVDYAAAGQLALEHFLNRGFRHFAYCGFSRLSYAEQHRREFERAVGKAGLTCDSYYATDKALQGLELEHELHEIAAWIKGLPKPVGVFCWSTQRGREVLHACQEADVSVPHEVAVLGGDYDALLSSATTPHMSGVVVPSERIGYEAAAKLHKLMDGAPEPDIESLFLPPTMVIEERSTDAIAIDDPDVAKALRFIQAHAYEPVQMQDILEAVPAARRSLERKFKQALGRSPADEIRRLRIARIKALLSQTDMSMPQIAQASGYATYNHMSNVFKKYTDVTPSVYRTNVRGRDDAS